MTLSEAQAELSKKEAIHKRMTDYFCPRLLELENDIQRLSLMIKEKQKRKVYAPLEMEKAVRMEIE